MNERMVFCAAFISGGIMIFEADEENWYEPCWIHQTHDNENIQLQFLPVLQFGAAKAVIKPIQHPDCICVYPCDLKIEEAYKRFLTRWTEWLKKQAH